MTSLVRMHTGLVPSGGCAEGHEVTHAKCITCIYHEEHRVRGILQNKDPTILKRRKITSEEGLRCRNEWPTTKATKVISVNEALTKLLSENTDCIGFARLMQRMGEVSGGAAWPSGGV